MEKYKIEFPGTNFEPLPLPKDSNLSEELTACNSPILFGCRSGLCGTCLVEIEGDLPPPSEEEREALAVYAENNKKARLACQVRVNSAMKIKL